MRGFSVILLSAILLGGCTAKDAVGAAVVGSGTVAIAGAIESAGKRCGGPFSVQSIDRDDAFPRVMSLRLTQ
jgi:hypothetical protein